ncbi:hypothetical protein ILUMI_02262 [Ignelater luminosus]|uniref:Uncharacterized protein n=1 Tax=Ignelater luminosus TaxID=2038154 RepID=A0A8K0GKZ6_IGNLU|nr:hypothetical protein ILUMI_02262 [Ignelater luminosus]
MTESSYKLIFKSNSEEAKKNTTENKTSIKLSRVKKSCQSNAHKNKKDSNNKEREKVRDRVRKHRANLSKEELNEKRRKDCERYKKKTEQGLIKFVKDLTVRSTDQIIKNTACNPSNNQCMLGACRNKCDNKERLIAVIQYDKINMDDEINFQQWATIKEERLLINLLHSKLIDYKKHVIVMLHQLKELQTKKQTIEDDELILHIDFAKNYVAKYSTEIQSMHFGASKTQLSLHTGVYHTHFSKKPFCSVSDTLDHQAHAIWAHLNELLKQLSSKMPNMRSINFFSDGPTSQYRNRSNIFYLLETIPSIFSSIEQMSWNYSESGHGKGPMDGVGGSLKRSADRMVLGGVDITCAADFVTRLKDTSSVKMWEVMENDILNFKQMLPNRVPSIPRIMSIHQIRELSCFYCDFGARCSHQKIHMMCEV